MKKIPQRTCLITKEKLDKKDLIRIVRTSEQNVIIDKTGKANGRGAYLKKDIDVLEKAQKSKALEKSLNIEIPNEIYIELKNIINN